MKILWLCNIMLPKIAESEGMEAGNKEGWLTGLSDEILRRKELHMELAVCFPVGKECLPENGILKGTCEGLSYYGFYEDVANAEIYDSRIEEILRKIIEEVKPDMVHIFGTEYPHTLAMTRVFPDKDKILIGLQGICGECGKAYMADLPEKIQNRYLFRDLVKRDNIRIQQKKFLLRGKNEEEALKLAGHIAGRTEWDKEIAVKINPDATYHVLRETLRAPFYDKEWNPEEIEKHSIFLSQGDYPLKGLHYLLWALPELLTKYPDTKVYVAGNIITNYKTLMQKIKIGSYGKYCLDLIRKGKLEERIVFLGKLSALQMRERYLKSHVFLCPSSLENSPNSVGEAMLLGMPVVSSNVGGVPSLLEDGKEGLLYPAGDTKAMIQAIDILFSDEEKALRLGRAARERAKVTHNGDANLKALMQIYEQIVNGRKPT